MTELLRCNVFTCDSAPLPGSLYCNEHKPAPSAEPPKEREWYWRAPKPGWAHSTQEDIGPPLTNPAPSAEPSRDYRLGQLCQSLRVLPLDLAVLISRAGLAIVPAADVTSPEERKVLETASAISDWVLENFGKGMTNWQRFAQAELARRAAKQCKP